MMRKHFIKLYMRNFNDTASGNNFVIGFPFFFFNSADFYKTILSNLIFKKKKTKKVLSRKLMIDLFSHFRKYSYLKYMYHPEKKTNNLVKTMKQFTSHEYQNI